MEQICSNRVETLLKRESERQQDLLKRKTEKKLACAENEQYGYFNNLFNEKYQEIEQKLSTISSLPKNEIPFQFDKISKEINALKKFMSDSLIFLRGYDIRVCYENIQELETKIKKSEEILLPKKKFGFKNKKTPKEISVDTTDSTNGVKKTIIFENNFFGFKNIQDNKNLILNHESLYKKDVGLQNLNNCIIFLHGSPSTLHISSLNNCLVFSGPVSTSIFAENCLNTNFVISCQQLRLHSSINCKIYIHVTSKAIIEDCKDIQVAPYNYKYENIDNDFEKSGLDVKVNHWDTLDDFNWLVAEKQSPNWKVMEENERVVDWNKYLIERVKNVE